MNHQTMIEACGHYDSIRSLDVEFLGIPTLNYGELRSPITAQDKERRSPSPSEFWVLAPSFLSGSDYSGSIVERSNYTVFLEQFSEVEGVIDVVGGHGTYAIGLTIKALRNEEIRWSLAALDDYPVMDEEKLSSMKYEAYQEDWKNWGCEDFRKTLLTHLEISEWLDDEEESDNPLYIQIQDLTSEQLQGYYESLVPSGEYFICESGYSSVWIPCERAARDATIESLEEFLESAE